MPDAAILGMYVSGTLAFAGLVGVLLVCISSFVQFFGEGER